MPGKTGGAPHREWCAPLTTSRPSSGSQAQLASEVTLLKALLDRHEVAGRVRAVHQSVS